MTTLCRYLLLYAKQFYFMARITDEELTKNMLEAIF